MNSIRENINFIENEDISRDSSGGVMSYLINLSSFFVSQGFKTTLYGDGPINDKLETGRSFSEFHSISGKPTSSNFMFFLRLFRSSRIANIESTGIIHVQRPEMVIPLKIRKKNRIICTLHGGQDLAVRKKKGVLFGLFYSVLQFISFVLVDELIAVDQSNLNRYIKKHPWIRHKISLVPISVDTVKFSPRNKSNLRTKFDFHENERILLFIGRLEYEKNVEFIIKAFMETSQANYRLIIVGNGSLYDELSKIASKDKNRISFLGEINNELIPEIINCSDVLVLASYFEGSPTVIKEALCCNVPVISTNVGDVKEVIKKVNGGEIIDLTYDSFVRALNRLNGKTGIDLDKIRFMYNHEVMGNNTMNIYQGYEK